jgi:hypothetical protein
MASKRKGPEPGEVRVRILPKDPLLARREGLWPVEIDIPCPTPASGPTGPHSVVVDYNADLDERFAPAVLQKNGSFKGLAALSGEKLLADFHFHQVNVWAIVERTLAMVEDPCLLGRAIPWASGNGRLLLIPHAGYMENAFYDRATGALHFFYFEGPDGKPVYTCLSHDIVTHELGHAVLDGLKPYYNEVSSPQTAGFHEYFGDAMAMMASLGTPETALVVTRDAPRTLDPRNVVSAIATEFGAAVRRIPDEEYLRGAWNDRRMSELAGTYEEHDWSEVLTGIYYDLLEYLYPRALRDIELEYGTHKQDGQRKNHGMRALSRAATATAGVMFRGLDYCPPVDLRYDEYARAVLRAQEVAFPVDDAGIRTRLAALFKRRGVALPKDESFARKQVQWALRKDDVPAATSTPADAYRFLDRNRGLFGIPYPANLTVSAVYRTKKATKSGYRPPREHIIEYVWTEDVALAGARFGELRDTLLPLWCGGTLVFDAAGNFLHSSLVADTPQRRKELKDYAAWLVRTGSLAVTDGVKGIGAPSTGQATVRAVTTGGRTRLERLAAARHCRPGEGA